VSWGCCGCGEANKTEELARFWAFVFAAFVAHSNKKQEAWTRLDRGVPCLVLVF